ncbi:MAG: CPBP family intramembrane metalloprotease [Acidobacteria bacterium]|nr:CPBP family intramembrane metalloprotease [Acidobacteriota bacterium]
MSDHHHPHDGNAEPIPLEGETWAPPAEDDNAATASANSGLRYVFLGKDGLRAGWSLLIFLALVVGCAMLSFFTLRTLHIKPPVGEKVNGVIEGLPSGTLFSHGIMLVILLAISLLMSVIERRRFGVYGLDALTGHRIKQFVVGLFWGLVMLSLLVFTLKATGFLVFDGFALSGSAAFLYGLKWAGAFLLVGLAEEYMLRGYLQFTLSRGIAGILGDSAHRKAIGFWIAALFFAFIFGLGHKNNPGESPLGLIMAGMVSLVFCLSLWRTGSLWWAVGWHAAWDWAESYLYGVADSGTMSKGHLINSHAVGAPLMSGGTTGPEGSIFVIPILILTALIIVFTLRPESWPSNQE